MTNEEIINEIKCLLAELDNGADAVSYLTQNDTKWLVENIKALEQESCEDCISREDAIEIVRNHWGEMLNPVNLKIQEDLRKLPSVKQEPKTDVLDKIRAELLMMECMEDAVEVIDKYMQEGMI